MLIFRAWEIKTMRVGATNVLNKRTPGLSFKYIEKSFLYIVKHLVLIIVLTTVKYWLIVTTKTKKWVSENWPKIHNFFKEKPKPLTPRKNTFVRQTILESRARVNRLKERIKKEHGESPK